MDPLYFSSLDFGSLFFVVRFLNSIYVIDKVDWLGGTHPHTVVCSSICATDISLMDWPVPPPLRELAPAAAGGSHRSIDYYCDWH